MARIGGDSPLTERGIAYARALKTYFEKDNIHDLRIWSSQKVSFFTVELGELLLCAYVLDPAI